MNTKTAKPRPVGRPKLYPHRVDIRLPRNQVKSLDYIGQKCRMTRSDLIRKAIDNYIQQNAV